MTHPDFKKIIQKNFPDQIEFLQKLVQTKSANPFTPDKTDPDEPVELAVAELIEKKIKEAGFQSKRVARNPQNRPNLLVKILGKKGGRALIFNGHMDTVLPAVNYSFDPFSGHIKDGKLWGLGVCDMKASLACFVFMAKALKDIGIKLGGDLILTFVIDEETGSCSPYGTDYLLKKGLRGDAAIVAEPLTYKIATGHRGRYLFKITTFGEAVHTGWQEWEKKKKGQNAIIDMFQIVELINNLEIPQVQSLAFPERKSILTFPTKIKGGKAINIVPERCIAYGDARLLPSPNPDQLEKLLIKKLKSLKGVNYKLESITKVWGVEISHDEEIVQVLRKHAETVLGKKPELRGCGPTADGWFFIRRGIPAICGFGPDGGGIHSADEWVDLESVKKVTEIYARTAVDYLGAD